MPKKNLLGELRKVGLLYGSPCYLRLALKPILSPITFTATNYS